MVPHLSCLFFSFRVQNHACWLSFSDVPTSIDCFFVQIPLSLYLATLYLSLSPQSEAHSFFFGVKKKPLTGTNNLSSNPSLAGLVFQILLMTFIVLRLRIMIAFLNLKWWNHKRLVSLPCIMLRFTSLAFMLCFSLFSIFRVSWYVRNCMQIGKFTS